MTALKTHSDCSDTKRTPEHIDEIQARIDNDPFKSIRSIARDIGVSEFLIRRVVLEDIWYSSYEMRKGQFFSQGIKDKRKTIL